MNDSDNETPELAPLLEETLDKGKVLDLCRQIEGAAEELEVRVKGGVSKRSIAEPDLWTAVNLLLQGDSAAVQLWYRYDGIQWIVTLLPKRGAAGMFRVVRTKCAIENE